MEKERGKTEKKKENTKKMQKKTGSGTLINSILLFFQGIILHILPGCNETRFFRVRHHEKSCFGTDRTGAK